MDFNIGLNQGALMQTRVEDFIIACGRYGLTEVELRVPKMIEALYHLSVEEFRSLLDDNHVRVTAVNSMDDFSLVPDDNLGILDREAETVRDLCIAARCDLVVAPFGRWFSESKPDWGWVRDRSAARLERIAEIFGSAGIRIGVEPIAFPNYTVWSLEESMEIIRASGVSGAVLVADVYNLIQGRSTVESMRRYGKSIGLIHVNDADHKNYNELDVMYTRAYPEEGILHPSNWVKSALSGGFDGSVSMEVFPKNLWELNADEGIRFCKSKIELFTKSLLRIDEDN